jgi:hypothetical protein
MLIELAHEETDDPLHADRRNYYKVEKCGSQACLTRRRSRSTFS